MDEKGQELVHSFEQYFFPNLEISRSSCTNVPHESQEIISFDFCVVFFVNKVESMYDLANLINIRIRNGANNGINLTITIIRLFYQVYQGSSKTILLFLKSD